MSGSKEEEEARLIEEEREARRSCRCRRTEKDATGSILYR